MEQLHLLYKASSLSYIRFGSGPEPAICFHGYGEEASSFAFLEKYGGDQYSFFAIDLPFHGATQWNEGYDCTIADMQAIVEAILNEHKFSVLGTQATQASTKLCFIGFSLGGRVALSLYQAMPSKVNRLVLLAPDGLKLNFWYWLATQVWIGNRLFGFTMKYPGWFFEFLKILNKLKLVNASIFKFVNYYIGDKEVRRLLYARWTTLRRLKPDLGKIRSGINIYHTKTRLVYGQHDRIILSSVGEKFRKGIEENCSLAIIHSGHQVLQEKHVHEILPALLQ